MNSDTPKPIHVEDLQSRISEITQSEVDLTLPQLSIIGAKHNRISVFPCRPQTKRPYTEHGFKDASSDPRKIQSWWQQHPSALVGMPTGGGIVVIDLDVKNNKDGISEFKKLQEKHGKVPETFAVRTMSGGWHLYFKYNPIVHTLQSSADKLALGVDIRASGGYVIIPPSEGYTVAMDLPVADLPEAWTKLTEKPKPKTDQYHPLQSDEETARECLKYVSPSCSYDDWIKVGMALRAAGCSFADFDQWSRSAGSEYAGERETQAKWNSFDGSGGVTLGTLVHMAKQKGYEKPKRQPDGRAKSSVENGKKGGRPQSPPHAETADRFIADKLTKDGKLIVRHYRQEWLSFDEKTGWTHVADAEMEARLITYLRTHDDLRSYATLSYARSVLLNLRAHDTCGVPGHIEMPIFLDTMKSARNWIAFRGTVVNIEEYARAISENRTPENYTRPLSPDYFSLDFADFEWDPHCPTPMFNDYLWRIQPELENRIIIQRMLGLLMSDITKYEVFWQLYGYGSNGKTVLLDIVHGLVGKHNVSSVDLAMIGERFQAWPLAKSKVNICGELATDIGRGQYHAIEGALKNCVSGGMIEFEKKNKDKFMSHCRARFIMCANSLPTFVDKSEGIYRRWRVIPFNEEIPDPEKDVNLSDKIIAAEMPGIAGWALRGLADVFKIGYFPDCPQGLTMKERHRLDSDHEKQFITEYYELGDISERINASEMYSKYSEWMSVSGYRACGAAKFYARVESIFPATEYKVLKINGAAVKGFSHLRIKNENDFEG